MQTMNKQIGSDTKVDTQVVAVNPATIRSIQLADGWHNIESCELIQYAVAVPHSPASPNALYAALRYTNEFGQSVVSPLRNVLALSNQRNGETYAGS